MHIILLYLEVYCKQFLYINRAVCTPDFCNLTLYKEIKMNGMNEHVKQIDGSRLAKTRKNNIIYCLVLILSFSLKQASPVRRVRSEVQSLHNCPFRSFRTFSVDSLC